MRVHPVAIGLLAGVLVTASPSAASTISTFDVLVATGTLIVTGTTTVSGNAFSVGSSTFVVSQGLVGIGTTTPVALLNLTGPVINGNGAQFRWIANKAALRSGEIQGTHWDSTGTYSVAFGFNSKASADGTAVGGGYYNSATAQQSTIAGGWGNTASGAFSAVGGGDSNTANADRSFIGGGYNNLASAVGAVVAGGGSTSVGAQARNEASGASAAVLGGISNTASGDYSAVPGGSNNLASGKYSFASGQSARAQAQGSFVWADSQSGTFTSSNTDEFKIRAQGGFVFVNTPTSSAPTVIVSSGAIMISTSAFAGSAVPNIFISSVNGNVGIGTMSPAATLDVNGSAQFGTGATKSTFTAAGLLKLNSSGIQWADGTTSTTATSGGSGGRFQVARSSGANDQTESATAWTALTGSTLSITVAANSKVWVVFNGVFSQSADNAGCQARVMQGVQVLSSTGVDCAYYAGSGSSRPGDCTIQHVTVPLSAGTYTYSVMFRSSSGGTTCQVDGATTAPWQLVAAEAL